MADISSYPRKLPKLGDLMLFSETYDANAADPAVGNPTKSATVQDIIDLVPSAGGGGGSVTSVAATGFDGISVIGSPITSSGTLFLSLTDGGIPTAKLASNIITINGTSVSLGGSIDIAQGSVTSVGLSTDVAAFQVTNSPVTSTGTLGLNLSGGSVGQFLKQDGTWATLPEGLVIGTTSTTAKAGDIVTITTDQAAAIVANTAKVGITPTQASDITANNAKISFDTVSSTRLADTSGVNTGDQDLSGIATNATNIATNVTNISTNTTDISTNVTAIALNTLKVGITPAQASDILVNNAKISFDTVSSTRLADTSGVNTGDQDLSVYLLNTTDTLTGDLTVTNEVAATAFLGDLNGTINTVTTASTKPNATNDTTVATTAFVKNLIGEIPAGLAFEGTWNADIDVPDLSIATPNNGQFWIVSVNGATNLSGITDWKVGDWAIWVEDGAGTNAWQKVDNSSVLDGQGTGQTVALWSGSGDSNTLTNAPITVSGNNVTITGTAAASNLSGTNTGDQDLSGYLPLTGGTLTGALSGTSGSFSSSVSANGFNAVGGASNGGTINIGDTAAYRGILSYTGASTTTLSIANSYDTATARIDFNLRTTGTPITALRLEGSGDATFAGNVTLNGAGDPILDIYRDSGANHSIRLHSEGTSWIDNNNNFGIGTNNPGAKLEIVSTGAAGKARINSDGNGAVWTSNGDMQFYTNNAAYSTKFYSANKGSALLTILDSGNATFASSVSVGGQFNMGSQKIYFDESGVRSWGIQVGSGNLNINSGDNSGVVAFTTGATFGGVVKATSFTGNAYPYNGEFLGGADVASANLQAGSTSGYATGVKVYGGGNATPNIITLMTASAERMRITSTGNVGIGTDSPLAINGGATTRLHTKAGVLVSEATEVARFEGGLDGDGASAIVRINTSNDRGLYLEGGRTGVVNFGAIGTTDASGVKNEAIRIDNTGNVGIGTDSPDAKLEVVGASGATTGTGMTYLNNTDDAFSLVINNAGTSAQNDRGVFDARVGGTSVFRVNNSGNVGIGPVFSNRALSVTGNLEITGNFYSKTGSLELGQGRTSNGVAYIDLTGQSGTGAGTDYGLRLIRNSGANASSDIIHIGTGNLNITAGTSAFSGTVSATSFSGSGSSITNVNAASVDGYSVWSGTQAAYNALTPDANTIYHITA